MFIVSVEYFRIVLITIATVAGARAFHAAYLNSGKVILSKNKSFIGLLEFVVLSVLLFDLKYNFSFGLCAAPFFMGVRLFSDYLLNILRGLPFHYMPDLDQKETLAISDSILGRVNRHTRLAIRIIILVLSALASYLLYINIKLI